MVTMECVEKVIRTNGMVCPVSGQKLKDIDIITIVSVSSPHIIGAFGYVTHPLLINKHPLLEEIF